MKLPRFHTGVRILSSGDVLPSCKEQKIECSKCLRCDMRGHGLALLETSTTGSGDEFKATYEAYDANKSTWDAEYNNGGARCMHASRTTDKVDFQRGPHRPSTTK